jgi:hypothetical protein
MIPADRKGIQAGQSVHNFGRVRTVSNDIAAAQNAVVSCAHSPAHTGFQRLHVGVDVTEDEIAHGV